LAVAKVGPGGIYLVEKRTVPHFQERRMFRLSDIISYETWEKQRSRSIGEVARGKVRKILTTHKPAPFPEDIER